MTLIETVDSLVKNEEIEAALQFISDHIDKCEDDQERAALYFRRGKIWWRLGNRSKAMSAYAESMTLDPDSPASQAFEHGREIEDFFNPDLLNP